MRRILTRLAEPKDAKNTAEWAVTDGNPVSTALTYPSTFTVAVDEEEETVLFQTAHPVLMLEALVVKPGLSKRKIARAIKALYNAMKVVADTGYMKEMYFFTKNPDLMKMVEKHDMFTRVDMPCYRCKL